MLNYYKLTPPYPSLAQFKRLKNRKDQRWLMHEQSCLPLDSWVQSVFNLAWLRYKLKEAQKTADHHGNLDWELTI